MVCEDEVAESSNEHDYVVLSVGLPLDGVNAVIKDIEGSYDSNSAQITLFKRLVFALAFC